MPPDQISPVEAVFDLLDKEFRLLDRVYLVLPNKRIIIGRELWPCLPPSVPARQGMSTTLIILWMILLDHYVTQFFLTYLRCTCSWCSSRLCRSPFPCHGAGKLSNLPQHNSLSHRSIHPIPRRQLVLSGIRELHSPHAFFSQPHFVFGVLHQPIFF